MQQLIRSIRPFIGAAHFDSSCSFYRDLGFEEVSLEPNLHLFKMGPIAFYLQRAYVKDWVDNTMQFVEVADLDLFYQQLTDKDLVNKYPGVRISSIHQYSWGREVFVHDPSGILWHFGSFV